jgi:hypothetical protein
MLEQVIRDQGDYGSGGGDDTYEAVLRSEFELMRAKFEK